MAFIAPTRVERGSGLVKICLNKASVFYLLAYLETRAYNKLCDL